METGTTMNSKTFNKEFAKDTWSKMDPELKAKWVAALRSGQYQQTVGSLNDANGYCCIGVLCDVVEPTAWRAGNRARLWNERESFLTDTQAKEFGIHSAASTLMNLNDGGGGIDNPDEGTAFPKFTFAEIADIIEECL